MSLWGWLSVILMLIGEAVFLYMIIRSIIRIFKKKRIFDKFFVNRLTNLMSLAILDLVMRPYNNHPAYYLLGPLIFSALVCINLLLEKHTIKRQWVFWILIVISIICIILFSFLLKEKVNQYNIDLKIEEQNRKSGIVPATFYLNDMMGGCGEWTLY
jgi:hypothetical protein